MHMLLHSLHGVGKKCWHRFTSFDVFDVIFRALFTSQEAPEDDYVTGRNDLIKVSVFCLNRSTQLVSCLSLKLAEQLGREKCSFPHHAKSGQ